MHSQLLRSCRMWLLSSPKKSHAKVCNHIPEWTNHLSFIIISYCSTHSGVVSSFYLSSPGSARAPSGVMHSQLLRSCRMWLLSSSKKSHAKFCNHIPEWTNHLSFIIISYWSTHSGVVSSFYLSSPGSARAPSGVMHSQLLRRCRMWLLSSPKKSHAKVCNHIPEWTNHLSLYPSGQPTPGLCHHFTSHPPVPQGLHRGLCTVNTYGVV